MATLGEDDRRPCMFSLVLVKDMLIMASDRSQETNWTSYQYMGSISDVCINQLTCPPNPRAHYPYINLGRCVTSAPTESHILSTLMRGIFSYPNGAFCASIVLSSTLLRLPPSPRLNHTLQHHLAPSTP